MLKEFIEHIQKTTQPVKIGRASCRERVLSHV